MTNEDKHEVCKYMKWRYRVNEAHVLGTHTDFTFTFCDDGWGRHVVFDLNDAGLCVQEMQKRGNWFDFYWRTVQDRDCAEFSAWLFNAENFFVAMAEWLGESCKINGYSSRVCEHGTKCCDVQHIKEERND